MKPSYLILYTIFLLLFITGCEPWEMEKRDDHDFVTFVTKIGETTSDKESWGIISVSDGGFVVVGKSTETSSDNSDIYIAKVDVNGNFVWSNTFGDSDYEEGTAIIELSGNTGFAIAGNKYLSGSNWQITLVKTDILGNLDGSVQVIGFTNEDKSYSLTQTGNEINLFGHSDTWQAAQLGTEAILYKKFEDNSESRYNFGNPLSNGTNLDDFGHALINTSDGNMLILTSYEDENSPNTFNLHLIKLNSSDLSVLWDKTILENCFPIRGSLKETTDGFIALGALSASRMQLIKTDSNGESEWSRSYDNADCELSGSICQLSTQEYTLISSGMTIIKTDGHGVELERTDYEGTAYGGNCILEVSDGGIVFTGTITNETSGRTEIVIAKMFPDITNFAPDL